jgi:hypothetical protein
MPNKWFKVSIQTRLIEGKQIYSAVTSDLKLFWQTYPQIWKKVNILSKSLVILLFIEQISFQLYANIALWFK